MIPESTRSKPVSILSDQRGATAVEYGLILSLVVLGSFVALSGMADAVVGKWTFIANKVTGL